MPKIARNLMRTVEVKLGLKSVDRRDWMSLARGLTRELVSEQLRVAGPIVPGDGARIFAFVGPSGVGKTTTMAKLASRMVLAEGMDVVMITSDTFRVGSVDQTRRYAELIGVPLVVADRPETMAAALRSYAGAEALLIDTPGRAFENEDVRHDLARILAATGEPVETHLLMAATYSSAQYGAVLKGFEDLDPSRIAVTKIDESTQYGGLLNIQSICDLPFSYLTGGHRVPEDIEVAKPGRITQLLFGPMD